MSSIFERNFENLMFKLLPERFYEKKYGTHFIFVCTLTVCMGKLTPIEILVTIKLTIKKCDY